MRFTAQSRLIIPLYGNIYMILSHQFAQATLAAEQKNWHLVNQYLQELLLIQENNPAVENQIDIEQILNLALQVLAAADFHARWEVAKILPKFGTMAIAPLIDILAEEEADWEWRWFVARILGEFKHPVVVKALVEVLKNTTDQELAAMVATTLAHLGTFATQELTQLLMVEETRFLAVQSLAQIRSKETIEPLLTVIQDPIIEIRTIAIEALSSFQDSRIPPVLLTALKDLAASVRKQAVIGLGMRSDLVLELDLVSQLKPLLYDFNLEVCSQTAMALSRCGTEAATEALFQVLKSPRTPLDLQIDIVRSLGWIGSEIAIKCLEKEIFKRLEESIINEDLITIILEIITVLGRIEAKNLTPLATQILIDLLQSNHLIVQNYKIKQSLAMAWGQLGESTAIDSLNQLLLDQDKRVKLHAIAALKKFT